MAKQVRSVEFLPEIFQTPINEQFLSATLDQLIQNPRFTQSQGFIGRRVGPGVNANDNYVVEPTKTRTDYQLEPGVVQVDPKDFHRVVDAITYPGITDALQMQGSYVDNAQRLYTSDYYAWDPFVDFDKLINYAQYFWLPGGPLAVDVSATGIPSTDSFDVTRENGVYTFSGVSGNNPILTLVRGGSYTFNVAQNDKETVNFRVTNNGTSSWNIDYQPNPTLTLVRGNTYVFNLSQTFDWSFYIKTQISLGTTNIYSNGVFNNGGAQGLVTFTVPQDAPDTLYYCNDVQINLQGQINIVDGTPGNGPGFWIQTDPGVSGRIPATPNISGRDVLGVVNNGEDLGTVTFDVPLSTAQNFYYDLPSIGSVDLITDLQFDQINNQFVDNFFTQYPNGIDGITNLNGRTIVFMNQGTDPVTGGWQQTTFFDPLPAGDPPGPGGFDSVTFDQTTPITDPAVQYSVWQIQYEIAAGGGVYMSLKSILQVDALNKFSIAFGDQWSNTGWYKNESGFFEQIPLLTAIKNILWYQDGTDPEIFGQIRIIDQTQADTLNVEEIIGQKNYVSPNGVTFTNGLKVIFRGDVFPTQYKNKSYYVQGVGTAIQLLPTSDYITPETYTKSASIPYDTTPYDLGNYDASLNQPLTPDYITISRDSPDLNPWSRSNRWFHIDVITASALYNNTQPVIDNQLRAKRPILEFRGGTRLFNFGTQSKQPVDIIDFRQTDALSVVNGSTGYSTDGYTVLDGTRIIFAADLDADVRKTIYEVRFVTPDSVPPLITQPIIALIPVTDGTALVDQNVVVLSGLIEQGLTYRYDGVDWIKTQQKNNVNQPPLFDIYDRNGVSFGNRAIYPSTDFAGSPLFSYAIGDAVPDIVLGFPLTYLSLSNIGDIVFDNNFYKDSFNYTVEGTGLTVPLSTGFVRQYRDRVDFVREIGWQTAVTSSLVRQQFQFSYDGGPLLLDVAVNDNNTVPAIQIFINGEFQESYNYQYTVGTDTTTINLLTTYVPGDQIIVAVLSDQISQQGFYQVPINLQNNPLNENSQQFSLGTIRNHYVTIAQNLIDLSGPPIGPNNVRDLGNVIPYGLQILQQSSPLTLTGYFMRDPNYNIFGALQYNSSEYIKFKTQLLNTVTTFGIADYDNWTVSRLLDESISQINLGKTSVNPFYWSDMLPTSPTFTSNSYVINPVTTRTFNLTQTYSYTESNYQGLCVYIDNVLLTRDTDYVVSTEGPTLTIEPQVPFAVGSTVTINEYTSTVGNFVPNTPTKLGLYPKYQPKIFYDTNYVNPTLVIQGHDGSITTAFGDIRDRVLLEFETRIYNNLKNDGNPPPLVAEDVIPGFFRTTDYNQQEINQILGEQFLAWVGANKLDYTQQTYLANNEFTYNYSQAGNRINNQPLLGAWRGIYRYFYDTTSPNTTPWEMLGLSEEPSWWADRYGPVPYTSDNLVLWGDLEQGLVADPVAPYVIPKYRRPGLTQVIPVDNQGNLLPPLQSVVGPYDPQGFVASWKVGDGGPVEASWWSSSSYPFAVMRLLILTRPAEFFSLFADRDLYKYSPEFDQYLYDGRGRIQPKQIEVYGNGISKASYIDWIVDYNQQLGIDSTDALTTDLDNIDVRLCYRFASFVAESNLAVYLEKGSAQSQNTSLLVPPESFNLLLYKNQPFNRLDYSAVIVEVVEDGYSVYGYSAINPYFSILTSQVAGSSQTLTAGNVTVTVPSSYTNKVAQIPYGYTFANLTGVVDFLLSYGQFLASQGLSFTVQENGYTLNWIQMAQEFLYFANQGWAPGTIINLNPSATQITSFRPGAVVDSIVTYTPENLLLDQNRKAFDSRDLIIRRQGNVFSLNPDPAGSQTISYLQLKYTDYENMMVLDNRTIFNDLIYDTITAERQNRLRLMASVSTGWNGVLNAQGFILNQDNVVDWQTNTKYTKGDMVLYKNSYWQAIDIIQPKAKFEYGDWYKSNYDLIEQGLLQNLATKAEQLANSYNTQTANLNNDNDLLAYGLIGFRPRQYMTDLDLSSSSQVMIYQQFIKTKGTTQATDLFTKVNFNKEIGEYNIFENWGILVGTYGANANRSWFDIALNEALLNGNPSTVQIIQPGQSSVANQTILLEDLWAESYVTPSTDILPTTYVTNSDSALPSAGYVNINDVDITVFNLNNPSAIARDIGTIGNGTSIWVAQINGYDWAIYRCAQVPGRLIRLTDNLNGTSQAQFSQTTNLERGDLIIVRYFDSAVDGVYRVISVPAIDTVVIEYAFTNSNQTSISGTGLVYYLQSMRVAQASDVAELSYANDLLPGARVWVDNDGSGHWQVIEKQSPFEELQQIQPENLDPNSYFGSSVSQSNDNYSLLVGAPNTLSGTGAVYSYFVDQDNQFAQSLVLTLTAPGTQGFGNSVDFGNRSWAMAGASASNSAAGYAVILYQQPGSQAFVQTQLLTAPDLDFSAIGFGASVIVSDDERMAYVGAPDGNRVYAYGRVDIPTQIITYVANGVTATFTYNTQIAINSAQPEQLVVLVNNLECVYLRDYTISGTLVQLTFVPVAGQRVIIARKQVAQLDFAIYFGVTQDFASGSGTGAVFTVSNTRGQYSVSITSPGINYNIGDTLTVSYTQIDPSGSVANDLTITVTEVTSGGITDFTISGFGVSNTAVFSLAQFLYTATSIDAFTLSVNGVLQRPNIDYIFSYPNVTFLNVPPAGAIIGATAGTYWQYIDTITVSGVDINAKFGASITTDQNGRQVLIGAPFDTALDSQGSPVVYAGAVYAIDRGVIKYIVDNPGQLTYAIPGSFVEPIQVTLNNQYLTNTDQYINGQYSVVGSNIVLNTGLTLNIGDSIEIETNQFQLVQKITANTVIDESEFGYALDICSNNCSVYIGAPLDSYVSQVHQSGMVQRQVNQSRVYGIITTTAANPALVPQNTIRINDMEVSVPAEPNNTVAGLVGAINSAQIPNVVASLVPNVILQGTGSRQVFDIGNIYSTASSYTPIVYVNNVLQILNIDYTYNNSTQQISFVSAPAARARIEVVAGRMTISVINANAAQEFNKLTVLPGISSNDSAEISAFYDLGFVTYAYTQSISSPNPTDYAYFGSSVNVNTGSINLVIGAPNGEVYEATTFDNNLTYFDDRSTTYFNTIANSGVVYTFDYLPSADSSLENPGKFVFGQQVYKNSVQTNDQFGHSVNYRRGRLVVGTPGDEINNSDTNYGSVTVIDNAGDAPVWTVIYNQLPMVDVNLLNSVYSYDKLLTNTQTYFDYIDPLQGKILGVARRNIDYIGAVDPASYNAGLIHNVGTSWGSAHLGQIWWDTNRVRFIDANQDNLIYASRRWGQVFPGSEVDVYQWIESSVPPVNYTGSGTPFSTVSYTVSSLINDQGILVTNYYFWVRGLTTVATEAGKTLSVSAIASYIQNPLGSGLPYIAALSANALALYNANGLLSANDTILHVEYDRQILGGNSNIHTEYEFITDGKPSSFLNANLYRKFIDSFCGIDTLGNAVPDPTLSPGMRYGVQFRPRQSMFVDRLLALKNYLQYVNKILAQFPISETKSFSLLNSAQPIPAANTGAWNLEVPNLEILAYQNIAAVPLGYKYLVMSDASLNGLWSIYTVTDISGGQRELSLTLVQNYYTPAYWNYINWYQPGYNSSITPIATVANTAGLQTLSLQTASVGSSVKVAANGQGKFEIYVRTDTGWNRVGLQDGTIEFSAKLWDYALGRFGFDAEVFDSQFFDQEPTIETRQIIRAINEELLIDELLIERNRALILMFQFIYTELNSPEWLVKTSYINVNHVIRGLLPIQLYQPDNQTFVLDYLNEVKPYHVQNLEFNLVYDGLDRYPGALTDYDVPAYYNTSLESPQFTSPILLPYTYSDSINQSFVSDAPANAQIWLERPWSDWFNNYLLSIQAVEVLDQGSGYTTAPTVSVSGECVRQAQMTAIINSAGKVVAITIDDPGEGYTTTAVLTLVGGGGTGATARAQMGNNLVRSFKTTIKYDRYQYRSTIVDWEPNVVYVAGTRVRWSNLVWSANSTLSGPVFIPSDWTRVSAASLSGVDRTMGFYLPGPNMPGLSLPLLVDGVDYPGVQVDAPDFNQNTGYDVGNFDINPFDNLSVDREGRPTYDYGILDVQYASSYLDLYLGTRPTDINVDGGAYIDTFSSHAPEELIPGSEFDTLDFRVYTTPGSDWTGGGHGFPAGNRRYVYDSANPTVSFAGIIDLPFTVQVFNATLGIAIEPVSYDWANYEVTLGLTETDGDIINVYVTGVGGGNQLYNRTYLGNEVGDTITVPFPYNSIYEFLIYNGETRLEPGVDYTWASQTQTSTRITFVNTYGASDRINLCTLGYAPPEQTTHSWSLPVFQTEISDGSLSIPLVNSLQGTNPVNLIVVSNGARLRPSEGMEHMGDGTTVTFDLPMNGGYSQGLISDNDVSVYVDNQPTIQGINYQVDAWDGSSARTITFFDAPAMGSVILISVRTKAQYWILGDELVFQPANGYSPTPGDIIDIVTWNDTSQQGLLTQVFVGEGESPYHTYDTSHPISNPDRILVTLDGEWLFAGLNFVTVGETKIRITGLPITSNSVIAITCLTQSVVPGAMAFRIFQDMRGLQATYRITSETTTSITAPVSITDDVIYVKDASALNTPDFEINSWGVVTINAERIMYRERNILNNTISSLLRGTAGTAVAAHESGATVYDMSRENLLPTLYQDYINSNTFMADGATSTYVTDIVVDNRPLVYLGGIVQVTVGGNLQDPSTYVVTQVEPVAIEFVAIPALDQQVIVTVLYLDSTEQQQVFTATGSSAKFVTSLDIGLQEQASNTYVLDDFNPVTVTFNTAPFPGLCVYIRTQQGAEDQFYFTFADGSTTTFVTNIDLSIPVRVLIGGIEQDPSTYLVTSLDLVTVQFAQSIPAGLEVVIYVRQGISWYQPGPTTASDGVPLQDTNTQPARFLRGL
jgi:hypothetical protein